MMRSSLPDRPPDGAPPSFALVLEPEFPINALVLATEALRIANQNSGLRLFDWWIVSESGEPVRATNGQWTPVDKSLDALSEATVLLVFGGNLPTQRVTAHFLARLRWFARHGTVMGAVDTGAFALARAGLLDGHAITLHWEAVPSFRERFPDIEISDRLFRFERDRITCAGGIGTLDMMLALIARYRGPALAVEVANALVHAPRDSAAPQRARGPDDGGDGLTRRLVRTMEANLETPLSAGGLAAALGCSLRSLERATLRAFGESLMRVYLKVRLQEARNLLFYEELSVSEVALACGFSYPSVFCRAFRRYFGESPREFRAMLRRQQSENVRPELRRLVALS
jgi:transcriptional regulator GlxA family with amidase domain